MNEAYNLFDKITDVLESWGQSGSNYCEFPNGFKVCWGLVYPHYGETFQLPVTYQQAKAIASPHYGSGSHMEYVYEFYVSGSTLTASIYNPATGGVLSPDKEGAANYLVVGY